MDCGRFRKRPWSAPFQHSAQLARAVRCYEPRGCVHKPITRGDIVKILLIVFGVLALLAIPMTALMFYGMSEIKQLVMREVDLQKIADGTYTGSYHKGRWTYDVEVRVQGHRIKSVKNTNARMNQALHGWNDKAEAAILARQSLDIDVVSGATVSSKAYQKAVELALLHPARP